MIKKLISSRLLISIPNSYSQIFFSDNRIFSLLLMFVSFFDPYSGIAGLLSVMTTNILAYLWGYDREKLQKGLYGFNSVIVGIGLGIYFEPSLLLYLLIIISSVFTLFVTNFIHGLLSKYYLPFLSLPFLVSIWFILLATSNFTTLNISHRGLYQLNEAYSIGGITLVRIYDLINFNKIPNHLQSYFTSLSAIFFQFNVVSGIFISIGLLLSSRIAFILSLLGFYGAYFFYRMIGVETNDLIYSYVGFNFILTAIAIGGYFVVPSRMSFLWVLITVPMLAILSTALNSILGTFHLAVYSMPFSVTTLLFLYALKCRTKLSGSLSEVYVQQYSPEKNLYSFQNYQDRFNSRYPINIKLPFTGFWDVSQGHNGEHTHKDDWQYAWDFVINGSDDKQFKNQGNYPEDYHCYNKAINAAADGTIEIIADGIEDNTIGDMNVKDNWGNTIIIKHSDEVFTKYSHLKKGSIKVRQGDTVKQGQLIAHCGNSGRSPYPHLHFQIQSSPYIGSRTIKYPLAYYLSEKNRNLKFNTFSTPQINERISNIISHPFIASAFNLIPGKEFNLTYTEYGEEKKEAWKVETSPFNYSYIECVEKKSRAYFYNDSSIHYFTHFEGNKKSMLYYFFLSSYKIQLGMHQNLIVNDNMALQSVFGKILVLHDFIAPFKMLLKVVYESSLYKIDNEIAPEHVVLKSQVKQSFLNKIIRTNNFIIELDSTGIYKIIVQLHNRNIEVSCSVVN